jgi:hypothetical protein
MDSFVICNYPYHIGRAIKFAYLRRTTPGITWLPRKVFWYIYIHTRYNDTWSLWHNHPTATAMICKCFLPFTRSKKKPCPDSESDNQIQIHGMLLIFVLGFSGKVREDDYLDLAWAPCLIIIIILICFVKGIWTSPLDFCVWNSTIWLMY